MDKMNEVFDILGIKPFEKFRIKNRTHKYSFDSKGNLWKHIAYTKVEILDMNILNFLRGEVEMENKTMVLEIQEMLEMQKALDKAIYTEHNTSFNQDKCKMAILDEIGELTHELKGEWCWWKKTQKPVDRQRVLEELCDIYHFVLSYHYNVYKRDFNEYYISWIQGNKEYDDIMKLFAELIEIPTLEMLFVLTARLGFTFAEVYFAYIEKNKTNYERLANNY